VARIPQAELERLKQEVSVQRLAEARGVKLTKHGQDLHGLCPFHDDTSPSLIISPHKNLWHCMGACQAGGSVIDWVMKAEAVSFRHAVELLRADSPTLAAAAASARPTPKHSTVPKLDWVAHDDATAQEHVRQVIEYYHETLKQTPAALGYLEKRGLKSQEAIERFKLGFCDRSLCYRLPAKNRRAGAELRGVLTEFGLLRSSGHEHFRGSVVIPIYDESGAVVEVYGRKVTPNLRTGTPDHLYLPGPHRGVWNWEALQATDEVILCEALIDALTFWCAGYRNVTSSYGVQGFTDEHSAAFSRHGIKRVLIAYDRDLAGDLAAHHLAERLIGEGIDCFRVQFPQGMDANAFALQSQSAAKDLGAVLRGATWLGQGKAPVVVVTEPSTQAAAVEPAADVACEAPAPSPLAAEVEATEVSGGAAVEALAVASPLPATRPVTVQAEVKAEEVAFTFGDRRWRIRGLGKNMSYDQLKVNVLCSRGEEAFHVDKLDLYSARHRAIFLKQAALELGYEEPVLKKDLGGVLLKLEELQEQQIKAALEPKQPEVVLTDAEQAAAMKLLEDPKLLDRILADFERCGVVGEESNKLMGYLAAVSRKLEEPLGVIIQSSSAAGKSSLMEAILAFMPEEEKVKYSAMTGQSLFYMGETDLKRKILAIVEEEGAERASYALKLLQSEGELTIASTGKEGTTGRLVTHEYRVEGPVMILLTTTAVEIDEELLNRCIVLTVDEDEAQTQAIHRLQRRRQMIDGLLANQDKHEVLQLHKNAQRMLRPVLVSNPYADRLTFVANRTRTRRDHMKYLTLLRVIAYLHQYQRPTKTVQHHGRTVRYIEVTPDDIAIGNRLAHQVLGRSLDELPPQTRRFLCILQDMVRKGCEQHAVDQCDFRLTRRQIREHSGWAATQTRLHLDRLVELEYVTAWRIGRGMSFQYSLMYDGDASKDTPHLCGLIDAETLRAGEAVSTIGGWRGKGGGLAGSNRPEIGPVSGGCRDQLEPVQSTSDGQTGAVYAKTAYIGFNKTSPSYVPADHTDSGQDNGAVDEDDAA
jgi:DNA primase catalytic core